MQSVFTVEEHTDHLHIYELSDDSYPSGIKVAPERGGIPTLFPICAALADGEYRLAGKVYQMKDHGFARNLPWRITASDTNGRAALSLQLNSDAGIRQVYPMTSRCALPASCGAINSPSSGNTAISPRRKLRKPAMGFDDPVRGNKIRMTFGPEFKYPVIRSTPGKEYVCVEPLMAKQNPMNTGESSAHPAYIP